MVQHISSQEIKPEVTDTQEDKLRKSLLIFAAAFMTLGGHVVAGHLLDDGFELLQ